MKTEKRSYTIREDGDALLVEISLPVTSISFGLFRDLSRLSYASQDVDDGSIFFMTPDNRTEAEKLLSGALFEPR